MVTAITLEALPIWNEGGVGAVSKTLKLAAMLSVHRPASQVKYPGEDAVGQLKKKLSKAVLSETDKRLLEAEKRAERAEEEKKKAGERVAEAEKRAERAEKRTERAEKRMSDLQAELQEAKRTKSAPLQK